VEPQRLIVTANAPGDPAPPVARSVEIDGAKGNTGVPLDLDPVHEYEIHASVAGAPSVTGAAPLTSEATTAELPVEGS
jgi:hypothetical protein